MDDIPARPPVPSPENDDIIEGRRRFRRLGPGVGLPGLTVLAVALFAAGCGGKPDDVSPRRVVFQGPGAPFAMPAALGTPLPTPLLFQVMGAPAERPDAEAREPAAGARVAFSVEFEDAGGNRVPVEIDQSVLESDAGGMVKLPFAIGEHPGIYLIRAHLPDVPAALPAEAVLLAGIVMENAGQDVWSGRSLPKPVVFRLETAPGVYADDGRLDAYREEGSPKGSRLADKVLRVDADQHYAQLHIHGGDGQGPGAAVVAPARTPLGPEAAKYLIRVPFFTVNAYMLIAAVGGGLALFIYGMKRMSEGLQFLAGDRLRQILHWLTSNRFVAVGVGLVVTAAIQSSSACSVMVVGFVNAGLMTLQQAIGVLMGANIGTTITAQIIAFKLDDIALPAIALGVIAHALAKSRKARSAAMILIGFGMLFLGLTIMGDSLTILKDSQWARAFFSALESGPDTAGKLHVWPVLKGVLAGLIVTVVVQSSSVTTGLLIMLAGAGLMDAYTAYAVLLGENIGTTVTAVLASLGATRAARRAALFHVLFNTFGVIGMVLLHFVEWPGTGHPLFMELVSKVTAGDPFAGENLPRYLANAHTLFNLVVAGVFLFLVRPMAALCTKLVPETDAERAAQRRRLEPKFLATPSIALQQVWMQMDTALQEGHGAIREAHHALGDPTDPDWDKLADSVKERERETDRFQVDVTEFLGRLSLQRLTEAQAALLPHLLHGVNDIERIGDSGRHLVKLARRARKYKLPFTVEARAEILQMVSALEEMFQWTEEALRIHFADLTATEAREQMRRVRQTAKEAERFIRKNATEFRKAHEVRHENGRCDIRSGVIFTDVIATLARVGEHLANVVEAAAEEV